MEFALDVRRRQQLARHDLPGDIGRITFDDADRSGFQFIAGGLRPATFASVRRKLHNRRHDVFVVWRERGIVDARETDFEHGIWRRLAVFRRVERLLDIVFARRDEESPTEVRHAESGNLGQTVEREMELGRITAGSQVMDPMHESRFEMSCADETEQGALRVRIGDDRQAVETLPACRLDADNPAIVDNDTLDRDARAHCHAG